MGGFSFTAKVQRTLSDSYHGSDMAIDTMHSYGIHCARGYEEIISRQNRVYLLQ